jgi:glycosyltransferase involved in cell wall biosynthesis
MAPGASPISVVIPLFNKANHVGRAVRSVLGQSVSDFELIVVDDDSTDGGAEVVKAIHDPRVRLVHQENAGVSAARNRGVAEGRADLIAFLDADDEWLPGFLATILRLQARFPDCGAYAVARDVVERGGRRWTPVCRGIPAPPWEGVIANYFRFADEYPVHSSGVAIPRHVFDAVGLFLVGIPFFEDTELWARIALKYPIAFSSQPLAIYHKDAENRACDRPIPLEHPITRLLETALESGILPPGVPREDVAEYNNRRHIHCAGNCVRAGSPAQARAHLRAAALTRRHRREWRYWYFRSLVPASLLNSVRKARRFIKGTRRA